MGVLSLHNIEKPPLLTEACSVFAFSSHHAALFVVFGIEVPVVISFIFPVVGFFIVA